MANFPEKKIHVTIICLFSLMVRMFGCGPNDRSSILLMGIFFRFSVFLNIFIEISGNKYLLFTIHSWSEANHQKKLVQEEILYEEKRLP